MYLEYIPTILSADKLLNIFENLVPALPSQWSLLKVLKQNGFFLIFISVVFLHTYDGTSSFSTALHLLGCEFSEGSHSKGQGSQINQKSDCCTSVLIRREFIAHMRENQMKLGTTYNNDVKDNVTGVSLGLYGLPIWTIWLLQIQQETLSQNLK